MKVSCSKVALLSGVQTVLKAVSPKATIPVLSGILMETCSQGLRLVAYDLDLGIETYIPVTIEREGAMVLPARYLADITRRLPHTEVVLEYREDVRAVEITSDRANFSVKTMPAEEFPALPEISAAESWSLPEGEFKTMIRKVSPAAAADDNRALMKGVYTLFERELITMVATDSFRLAHRTMPASIPVDSGVGVIVPSKTLIEVEKNLNADGDRQVAVSVTQRHAMFRTGSTTYVTRLLEGQFPNYKQVFPQSIPARIMCDRLQLLESIDRVSLLCKDELSAIKMVYTGDEGMASGFLTISANTPEIGEATEDIPVSMVGHADVTVALRARYLRDVLRVLDGNDVSLGYISFKHPMVVKDDTDPSYTYLVMPVTSLS
ncbi:MAG: DNA polymerase III subunit beta [Clostridia bacterium]|nr:DNA polymerase III subunit beta [Clostridia bacterium]